MVDQNGKWLPDLSPKGYVVFNDYHRYLLLHGPRKSTKTTGAVNKIARHLFENDGAVVAVIGKTLRNIKSSGVWQDLIKLPTGLNQWINADIGFKFTVEPKMTGDTHMTYFRVRNLFGTESELQVHSLLHEHEVEEKFKSTRFSMIYLPEVDQFKSRATFDILEDQLRIPHISYGQHQLLGDCNPPEEGEDHWLHDVWFKQKDAEGEPLPEEYRSDFRQIGFCLDDNPFISDREKNALKAKYVYDKIRYARFVEGKWEKDETTGHFADYFVPNIHVRGNIDSQNTDDCEVLVPGPNTIELVTGWDLGDVNHSFSLLSPRNQGEDTAFDLIDELVVVKSKISITDFTEAVLEIMDDWEDFLKSTYNRERIMWRHWSDMSAFKYNSAADAYHALIVRQASSNRIHLQGVSKPAGSVKKRVGLVKKLLFEDRLFFSAKCHMHIDMMRRLKQGSSKAEVIDPQSPLKHPFDSLTYPLSAEAPFDLERRNEPTTKPKMVSVPA